MFSALASHLYLYTINLRNLWRLAKEFLIHPKSLKAEGYVASLYKKILHRNPDSSGLTGYVAMLRGEKNKLAAYWRLLIQFLRSPEYAINLIHKVLNRHRTLDVQGPMGRPAKYLIGPAIQSQHHLARMELVQRVLPKGDHILDLGGGSAVHPGGALMAMGYGHHPKGLTIIDLPPETRVASSKSTLAEDRKQMIDGVPVTFIHDSFLNLDVFNDASFDLVFSGQTIEHIEEEEAQKLFRDVHRILRPGGRFCLDTPNRRITKIVKPKGYIHIEHKIEYFVEDLLKMGKSSGFEVEQRLGITPMPRSMEEQVFDASEFLKVPMIDENAEAGFSFYLGFVKR